MRQRIPFYEQVGHYAKKVKRVKILPHKNPIQSPKLSSPKLLRNFSPVGRVIRRNSYFENVIVEENKINSTNENNESSCNEDDLKDNKTPVSPNKNKPLANSLVAQRASSGTISCKKEKVLTKSRFFEEAAPDTSPSMRKEVIDCSGSVLFCVCGKICTKTSSMCEDCLASCKLVEAAGYLYVKRDENNLDRLWFQLVNTDLYCKKI